MKKDKNEKKENSYNSDITKDDKQALKERQGLQNRTEEVDFAGKDLDVPGRKLPNDKKNKKLKDEENSLYGQGSGSNDNLEKNIDK